MSRIFFFFFNFKYTSKKQTYKSRFNTEIQYKIEFSTARPTLNLSKEQKRPTGDVTRVFVVPGKVKVKIGNAENLKIDSFSLENPLSRGFKTRPMKF